MESLSELLSRASGHIWVGQRARPASVFTATGYPDLDNAIGGGWPAATLVELLVSNPGLSALCLILPCLAVLTRDGKSAVWISAAPPYAPALYQAGVNLSRLLLVTEGHQEQRLWAAEQCLHSGVGSAVVMTETGQISDICLRRLKLAAAAANITLFLQRPESAAAFPSPASLRLRVSGMPFSMEQRITILKCSACPPRTLLLHPLRRMH